MIDNAVGLNRGLFRVGRALDADGVVTGGWTAVDGGARLVLVGEPGRRGSPWSTGVRPATSSSSPSTTRRVRTGESIGWAGHCARHGALDVKRVPVARRSGLDVLGERGRWRGGRRPGRRGCGPARVRDRRPAGEERRPQPGSVMGWTLDGVVAGGWSEWVEVPDWFSWENQGGGIAVVDRGATRDLVVFAVDNPPGQNQAFYRVAANIDVEGQPGHRLVTLAGGPKLVLLGEPGCRDRRVRDRRIAHPHRADGRRPTGSERRVLHTAAAGRGPGDLRQLGAAAVLLAGPRDPCGDPAGRQGHVLLRLRQQPGPPTPRTTTATSPRASTPASSGTRRRRRRAGPTSPTRPRSAAPTASRSTSSAAVTPSYRTGRCCRQAGTWRIPATGTATSGAPTAWGSIRSAASGASWGKMADGRWYPTAAARRRPCWPPAGSTTSPACSPHAGGQRPGQGEVANAGAPGGLFGMPLYAHLFLLARRPGAVHRRPDGRSARRDRSPWTHPSPVTITGVPGLDDPVIRQPVRQRAAAPGPGPALMIIGGGPRTQTRRPTG